MKQDFSKVMSKRTAEELIEIVRVKREDYQPEAVEAAKKELDKRQVNPDQIEEFEQELTEKVTKIKEFNSSKVPSWTRLIHFIVDIFGFFLTALNLSFIIGLFIGFFAPTSEDQIMLGKIGYLLMLISFFLYYVIMEYKYQKTIGKFLTKTKVVMNDGRKPELNVILYRTASRLIPFDQISFLFTKNGFHDRFSNTTVIKDEKEKTNANST